MKSTIESVIQFSKHPIIVYCVDFASDNVFIEKEFIENPQVIFRTIKNTLSNVYYYKPFVIADALKQGLLTGYYIESDDIITPYADAFLTNSLRSISYIPISPIHPEDLIFHFFTEPGDTEIPPLDILAGCNKQSQHYTHGHVLFTTHCLPFILQWLDICTSSMDYYSYRNADETVLNLLYWKYNCQNHHLPIIDPYYDSFYTTFDIKDTFICSFHGCKDPIQQRKLLYDIKSKFDNQKIII
jgi:hypothetical protein